MKLLVTGGAGFIGSNFIHYILKKYPDYQIVNLDLLTYAGNLENLKDLENDARCRFVKGNITDVELVNALISEVDMIVHLAAESHVDRAIADPSIFIETNIVGTHTLLEAAKKNGGKRFHHVSTDEVFGSLDSDGKHFNENTPYDPRNPYSASKAASDHLVKAYFHTFGLPITISNCSSNYGPYQFPEKIIPLFITNLMEVKKIPLYGNGMNVSDWLHVEDHCRAIDAVMHNGIIGDTYCVGDNSEWTNMKLANRILEMMGKEKEMIEFVEDRRGRDNRFAVDFSKIRNELGWEPKVNFEDGLLRTIGWYRDNEQWWRSIKSGDYKNYYSKQSGGLIF